MKKYNTLTAVGNQLNLKFIESEVNKTSDALTREMIDQEINRIYNASIYTLGYGLASPIVVISPKQMEAKKQREELHENKETYSEHTKGFILNFKEV